MNEELPDEDNLYITPKYSIENDIVNKLTCTKILLEVCNLTKLTWQEKKKIEELFEQQLANYQHQMIRIMSWIILWRRNGLKPCLDNIQMKHLFSILNGRLAIIKAPRGSTNATEYLHKQCQIDYTQPLIGITKTVEEFTRSNGEKKSIRGKFLLWFMIEFILSIYSNISHFSNIVKAPPKMHTSLNHGSAMVLISSRARIPKSLGLFLARTCGAFSHK